MTRLPFLFAPIAALLLLSSSGCSETSQADEITARMVDDASALAALADGDGADLGLAMPAFAEFGIDAAADEDIDFELAGEAAGFVPDCRFVEFRRRVIGEYDSDDDGRLSRDERLALRDDFSPRPLRRRPHARFHKRDRLRWIYDADDSGRLDAAERNNLRMDLELRCMNRRTRLIGEYDVDNDGELDEGEWSTAIEALVTRRAQRREAFVAKYDANEDDHLDGNERIQARIDRLERILARREAALEAYDEDGDGQLSADEKALLRERLRGLVRGEHLTDEGADT